MGDKIETVSDYIQHIETLVKENQYKTDQSIVVYRGESCIYPSPCQPNIFRSDLARRDPYFEKNLLDEMNANHATNGFTYLERAIDAQHGGFPSRLLDVTYNCLVALYFAVTPYYTQKEDSLDQEDGAVYLFTLEAMYCPTGKHINDAYNACISQDQPWFSNNPLFQKNHKLIDHIKKNPRIIAQQGAFILFQGEQICSIPPHRYQTVPISKESKTTLRRELREFFGIHTGSIYPEEFNLVNEMIRKSGRVSSVCFSQESEMELTFYNIEQLVEHYLDILRGDLNGTNFLHLIHEAEEALYDYRMRLLELNESLVPGLKEYRERFNQIVDYFAEEAEDLMVNEPEYLVEVSRIELCIPIE